MQTATLTPVDTDAIRATIGPWTRSAIDRDWDAFLALCTDDVVFLQPDGPMIESEAAQSWLESYPIIKRFDFDFDHIDGQADLAFGRGGYRMTVEIDGAQVHVDGKFVDVFRKNAHGEWRYAVVIWNSNVPAGSA